jgi:AraC-like DNA-binding protein
MLNLMAMSSLVAADDVPVAQRRDYWHHALDHAVGPLDVRTDGLDSRDRLRAGAIGPLRVVELSAGRAGVASLTPAQTRRADVDVCKIDALVRGHGVVEQDGRQARLGPGDIAFVDLARPVRWAMSPMQVVAVIFPRVLLPLRPDDAARLTGLRIAGDSGVAALVSSLARQLADHLDDRGGTRLGAAVLDLVTAGLAARLERDVPPDTRRGAMLLRIQAFIEQRLGDPDLSPATIAAAHHVSVRYVYRLFDAEETSVAGWVRRRRLERCRRDLLEGDEPVSAIAARWGLRNAAHFSRAFRAAYGVSPVEYRALASS